MISPVVYIVLVFLGVLAVGQYLMLGRRPAPKRVRGPLIALIATVVAENLYYGIGRIFPEYYNELTWWWPGVLACKVSYCVTLAILNFRLRAD